LKPRISLSKNLLKDKLFVSFTSIGSYNGQNIKLEYLLNKNITLQAVRDEIGSIGADIKLKYEFE
ncbi:protein of unknown function DUF490, partial [Candidatus Magnetoovum chiemensis]